MLTFDVISRVLEMYVSDHRRPSGIDQSDVDHVLRLFSERDFASVEQFCEARFHQSLAQRGTPATIAFWRQIPCFFKKADAFRNDELCQKKALESFLGSEANCKTVNDTFDNWSGLSDPYIDRARSIISSILGTFENFYTNICQYIKFSNGATSTLSRRDAHLPFKCKRPLSVTPTATKHLEHLFGRAICANTTLTNKIAFVPKNWKTDRTIACEPTHNMCFQLAFDSYVKVRLRTKANIDLSDQTLNQLAAFKGSLDNSLSTIDLSSASDSLAFNTVCLLLPRDWFDFLNSIRSPCYIANMRDKRLAGVYAKFSSMGNGATFALETLIFYALCKSVGTSTCVVYGDDIIVDSTKAYDCIALLRVCGFKTNIQKTFITKTNFRESCGTDWYNGKNVTPVSLRHLPRSFSRSCSINDKQKIVVFCNQLLSICEITYAKYVDQLVKLLRLPVGPRDKSLDSWVWSPSFKLKYLKDDFFKQHAYCYGYARRTRTIYVRHSLVYIYSAMRNHQISSDLPLQAFTIDVGVRRRLIRYYKPSCPS